MMPCSYPELKSKDLERLLHSSQEEQKTKSPNQSKSTIPKPKPNLTIKQLIIWSMVMTNEREIKLTFVP